MKTVAVFVLSVCVLSSLAPAGAAQIRLNELIADPASDWDGDGVLDTKLDEWVEVVNTGPDTVDLSNYRLSDASGGTDTYRFALSGALAPGAAVAIYGADAVAWQASQGIATSGLSLNNGGDTVYLYDVSSGTPVEVDVVTYAGVVVIDDRAIGRIPSGTGNWVVFDGLNPYSGDVLPPTGCMPSPGEAVSCPTPVEETSWGRVKSLYMQ